MSELPHPSTWPYYTEVLLKGAWHTLQRRRPTERGRWATQYIGRSVFTHHLHHNELLTATKVVFPDGTTYTKPTE